MDIECLRLTSTSIVPRKAHHSDAGFDLFADKEVLIPPGQVVGVGTGVALAIPGGYYGQIGSRSGLAINAKLFTIGGVIDSGYRDELIVIMVNFDLFNTQPFKINVGDKIAQIMIIQLIDREDVVVVERLSDTVRGTGGFGSTGS